MPAGQSPGKGFTLGRLRLDVVAPTVQKPRCGSSYLWRLPQDETTVCAHLLP